MVKAMVPVDCPLNQSTDLSFKIGQKNGTMIFMATDGKISLNEYLLVGWEIHADKNGEN